MWAERLERHEANNKMRPPPVPDSEPDSPVAGGADPVGVPVAQAHPKDCGPTTLYNALCLFNNPQTTLGMERPVLDHGKDRRRGYQ